MGDALEAHAAALVERLAAVGATAAAEGAAVLSLAQEEAAGLGGLLIDEDEDFYDALAEEAEPRIEEVGRG